MIGANHCAVASGQDEVQARRSQYKQAALDAKNSGDLPMAKKYMVIVKHFDMVLEAMNNGQPVDLSQMPPSLTASSSSSKLRTSVVSITMSL